MTDLEEVSCGQGTFNGGAADVSQFGFSVCILPLGHNGPCDSGPAPDAA